MQENTQGYMRKGEIEGEGGKKRRNVKRNLEKSVHRSDGERMTNKEGERERERESFVAVRKEDDEDNERERTIGVKRTASTQEGESRVK